MRGVVVKRRLGAGVHLELLVAHERGDRAFDYVDALVLARMGVDRRLVAAAHPVVQGSPVTA